MRLTASRVGDEVEFAVADNGPGLGEEELDHVFERFWRAQSGETQAVGGTGLGLAIAKSLVELHGGAISAESDARQGRYLPLRAADRQGRAGPAATGCVGGTATGQAKPTAQGRAQ